MMNQLPRIYAALIFLFSAHGLNAQISVAAQLRTRSEYRDGQGAPLPKGAKPAIFTSQRTRLTTALHSSRVKLSLALQDVRVWGQDASTINRFSAPENNGLMLHEAWADVLLSDTAANTRSFRLKLGRQELVYDDQRLLGNLDWLQQGRRHDAVVAKYDAEKWMVHLGSAFNQNREKATGAVYNSDPPVAYAASTNGGVMYKSMAFAYAQKKLKNGHWSFLFFSDQFNRHRFDTGRTVVTKQFVPGVSARFTTGSYFNKAFGNIDLTAGAYYQFGKNAQAQRVDAKMVNLQLLYRHNKWTAGAGMDYTSGSKMGAGKSFDPLYGTPHKFWGLMDYFYAASPFGVGGLMDHFVKTRYQLRNNLAFTADVHHFVAPAWGSAYGQELDITGLFSLTKEVSFEAGYAQFFSGPLMSAAAGKQVSNPKNLSTWAYLMINIRPQFFF